MAKLILASKSPRRKQVLKENGFKFTVSPADIDEEKYENLPPLIMVKTLAKLKAEKIAKKYKNDVVISFDTTVDLKDRIISKPKDKNHAIEILNSLSGSTHKVITGYAIVQNGKTHVNFEITKITFNKLTKKQISDYVNSVNVLGFAGAYGIQDKADKFVKNIDGDYSNVIGVPTKAIKELKKMFK